MRLINQIFERNPISLLSHTVLLVLTVENACVYTGVSNSLGVYYGKIFVPKRSIDLSHHGASIGLALRAA